MVDLTFRQLEVFVQVVESGSFRGCAERLGISQVSISSHIKSLETQIGTTLFERKRGSTATVTAAGEDTYRRAKDLLRGRAELLRHTRPMQAAHRSSWLHRRAFFEAARDLRVAPP